MTCETVVAEQSERSPRIEIQKCERGCAVGKVAIVFEMTNTVSKPDEEFIQQEIARRGAFFPADYGGGGRGWR